MLLKFWVGFAWCADIIFAVHMFTAWAHILDIPRGSSIFLAICETFFWYEANNYAHRRSLHACVPHTMYRPSEIISVTFIGDT